GSANSSNSIGLRRPIDRNIGIPYTSAAIRLHAECADPCAHAIITQRGKKHPHTRTLTPVINDKKIVVFRRNRQKTEAVQLRYRLDGESPVGATLSNCRRDRVVRFWLIGVASWACAAK